MRLVCVFLLILACGLQSWAGPPQETPTATEQPAASAAQGPATLPTEKVEAAGPADRGALPGAEGAMAPAQVKELLHNIWLTEFRINDLLTEVKPERWKMADVTRDSFQHMLEALRRQLEALEEWRGQFDGRLDSAYLTYETYAAISGVLPRLDGVGRSIAQHENPSFGAQFSQAGNKLFDQQQTLGTYLGFLLRNQDQVVYALQGNLAACYNELSYAMRGKSQPATPMKNVRPEFKGRRVRERAAKAAEQSGTSDPSNPTNPPKPR